MIEFIKDNFIWVAGIITAMKWVYEYSQNLRWQRSRLLLEKLEDFLGRESTEKVHHLLDWNKVKIEISGTKIPIDDEILYQALQTHDKKSSFTETELKIRDLFDEYFDGLTEFLLLSECGLVNKRDFRKFMVYWIDILNGKSERKPKILQQQIESYLKFYGFDKLYRFIHRKSFFWDNFGL